MTSSTGRSYADAIALLDSLQSNRAIVSSISNAVHDKNLDAIPEMLDWTRKAGYDVRDVSRRGLKCVHVAGTKGKGSVCAVVENILLQYQKRNGLGSGKMGGDKYLGKVGLYTSPHLVTVRERIRIDGAPISESMFTHYFFELWDRFSSAATSDLNPSSADAQPGYFRYLTLLALHTFMKEGVESAIVECGIGGEYDSTNILPPEAVSVSAFTKLGIDHVGMLGNTIESIAWHKGGILKHGVPGYTVEQVPQAQAVLKKRAAEIGSELTVVERLPASKSEDFKLGLGGDFQKDNASLAIAVAALHLQKMGITAGVPSFDEIITSREALPVQFLDGLQTASWPGRWEVRKEGNIDWLIDGAHTIDSLEATAHWYLEKLVDALSEEVTPTSTMLIFNQQDRDAKSLIRSFLTALDLKYASLKIKLNPSLLQSLRLSAHHKMFTFAAFCTNIPFKDQVPKDLDLLPQKEIAKVYENVSSNSLHMCFGSVEEAVDLARRVSKGDERVLVLVTGSLHLVGALMKVLDRHAIIEATNPQVAHLMDAPQELEQALENEDPIQFAPGVPAGQAPELTTGKAFESDPNENERARNEIFNAFLSTISPESRANIMGEDLIESPAPGSGRSVHYFHARPQPFHKLRSAVQITNEPSYEGKPKRVRRPSKYDIEAFFSDTKMQSQDSSSSGDDEISAAVSNPDAQKSKNHTKS